VEAAGALRPTGLLSVGTREQLSTLFRLSLAEDPRAAIVLDDQLVQSDVHRMERFRTLLYDKAQAFQIIVMTCRPQDYFPSSFASAAKASHFDLEGTSSSRDRSRASPSKTLAAL
jgi:uncharacterized protein YhaN